ncbi:globin family protein [Pelagibius sp.]|uniref:globin family protein n=1 Tax=Pelagibius sp. TaxID=1931238 RepID=UPI00261F5662|nr:globin family protein [Pelagibius sp.]
MTEEERHLVQESWAKVQPISSQAAALFYGRLFILAPGLKSLFKGDMTAQGERLMHMIDTAVGGLENLDELVPALEALGERHAGYGVTEADYDTVAAALLWTLEQGLGEAFTEEVKTAWITTYNILTDTMKRAAAQAA